MNNSTKNKIKNQFFKWFAVCCTLFGVGVLIMLLYSIGSLGLGRLNWDFFTSLPSRIPEKAGIKTALAGMAWIIVLTMLISFPIGIGAGIYLQEYGVKNRFAQLVEINIANLAGVPSVIYGILGLELFVRTAHLGNTLLAGSLTLSLLILPIIIVTTREALKSVPSSLKEAAIGLGATKLQTIYRITLPSCAGNIITGLILAVSRAAGETAPVIVIGALVYVPFVPDSPMSQFTILPIQIFNWISRPQHGFAINAAAGIIVLIAFVFLLNTIAIVLRNHHNKRTRF